MYNTNKEAKEMLLQMIRSFSKKEVMPYDMMIDKNKAYPKDLWKKVIDNGLLGLITPYEYGGAGFDPLSEADAIYEIASYNASLAFTLEGHFKTVNQIIKYGTDMLKDKYLPETNKRIFGFGSTEPQGGSNVLGFRGTAIKDGNHWFLNGNKAMITNGPLAEVFLVLLKTSEKELSCFLVDKDMKGFQYGKAEDFLGMRGTPV